MVLLLFNKSSILMKKYYIIYNIFNYKIVFQFIKCELINTLIFYRYNSLEINISSLKLKIKKLQFISRFKKLFSA